MTTFSHDVEILLVEDNPDDAGLVMRALKKNNIGNNIVHLSDGAEALEFIFATGKYTDRKIEDKPKVILLDLKMPKVDGLQVLRALKADERDEDHPGSHHDLIQGRVGYCRSYKIG